MIECYKENDSELFSYFVGTFIFIITGLSCLPQSFKGCCLIVS